MAEYNVDQYRDAARRAKAAGNLAAAKELARRGMALQNTAPQKPTGDTSFSTAVKVGDQRTKANVADYLATMQANPGPFQRFLRDVQKTGAEYVGNPVREFLGFDEINFDEVNAQEAERLRKIADAEGAALDQLMKDSGFESMSTEDIKGLKSLAQFAGQKTGESLPQMLTAVASGGFGPLLQMGFFQPAELAQNLKGIEGLSEEDRVTYAAAGGALMGALDAVGVGQVFRGLPDVAVGKMGPGEIYKRLVKKGLKKEAADFAKAAAAEGVTEGLQEATSMSVEALAGKDITFDEATGRLKEAAITGSVVGGTMRAPVSAANVTSDLFKNGALVTEGLDQNAAAGSVARRLRRISENNNYNLKEVKKGGGANNALENTRNEVVAEIDVLVSSLKKQLDPKQAENLDAALTDYAQSKAAIKQGKNKVANKVTKENLQALQNLVGGIQEGDLLIQKLHETNIVTDLFQDGLKGGVSQFTDYLNPLSASGSLYDPGRGANIATSVLAGGGLLAAGGLPAMGLQGAAVAGGRAIDAVTGRRSNVDRFARANRENQPFVDSKSPSLQDIQVQEEMAATEARRGEQEAIAGAKDQYGSYDYDQSPVGKMLLGTGLDRQGLKDTLSELQKAHKDTYVGQMAQSALDNLEGGEGKILDLTELIGITNSYLNSTGNQDRRVDKPDSILAQRDLPPIQSAPPEGDAGANASAFSPNYEKGVAANQAMAARLKSNLAADLDVHGRDKALLEVSLDNVQSPLGRNPVEALDYMIDSLKRDGVDEAAIETYLTPYRDRVAMQQQAAQLSTPDTESSPEISFDQAMATIPSNAPAQPSLSQALEQSDDEFSQEPILKINPVNLPPVPRGLTTEVPMENTLNRSFEVAKNTVFPKGRDLKQELQRRSLANQKTEKVDLTQLTPETAERLSDFVVNDALEALVDNSNAIGWYDKTITDTLDTLSELYPEIRSSQPDRLAFTWALAVTSNGLKVDKNLELAAQVYDSFKQTGTFPKKAGIGEAAKAINEGLGRYHTMLDKFDGNHQALEDFMNSKQTVRDMEKEYGVKISGEGKGEMVRGASVLGPKIGNGFFSNLYGNFDALTMDRWLMRTVGRWRGTLIQRNPAMERKKRDEMWSMLSKMDKNTFKAIKALVPSVRISQKSMSDASLDKLSQAIQKHSMKPEWRAAINEFSEDFRKTGNGLAKYLDGQVEQPAGTKERAFIREVFNGALARLNETPEVRQNSNQTLTMSDLQALLWYPEKRLYDTAKQPIGDESRGYADDEAPDYANAARKLVQGKTGLLTQAGSANRTGAEGQGNRLRSSGPNGGRGGGPSGSNAGSPDEFDSTGAPGEGALSQGALSPPPVTPQIKQNSAPARALFNIGEPGGEFENGIQDLDTAAKLSAALGQTVELFKKYEDMLEATGYKGSPTRNVRGLFRTSGAGTSGRIFGLLPGAQLPNGQKITSIDALATFLHEVSHGIAKGSFRGDNLPFTAALMSDNNWEGVIEGILNNSSDPIKRKVRDEIINLQDNRDINTVLRPNEKRAVRALREKKAQLNEARKMLEDEGYPPIVVDAQLQKLDDDYIKPFQAYYHQRSEFAVDPIWTYLINPKLAKEIMPETTKLIRENFRKAKNPTIQFYAHPLAMAVAIMLTIMFGEEEEQQQQVA